MTDWDAGMIEVYKRRLDRLQAPIDRAAPLLAQAGTAVTAATTTNNSNTPLSAPPTVATSPLPTLHPADAGSRQPSALYLLQQRLQQQRARIPSPSPAPSPPPPHMTTSSSTGTKAAQPAGSMLLAIQSLLGTTEPPQPHREAISRTRRAPMEGAGGGASVCRGCVELQAHVDSLELSFQAQSRMLSRLAKAFLPFVAASDEAEVHFKGSPESDDVLDEQVLTLCKALEAPRTTLRLAPAPPEEKGRGAGFQLGSGVTVFPSEIEETLLAAATDLAMRVGALEQDLAETAQETFKMEERLQRRLSRTEEGIASLDEVRDAAKVLALQADALRDDLRVVQEHMALPTGDEERSLLTESEWLAALRQQWRRDIRSACEALDRRAQDQQAVQHASSVVPLPVRMLGVHLADEPLGQGARVVDLVPASPAHLSGVVLGDVVVSVNGVPVRSVMDVIRCLTPLMEGAAVRLGRQSRSSMSRPFSQAIGGQGEIVEMKAASKRM